MKLALEDTAAIIVSSSENYIERGIDSCIFYLVTEYICYQTEHGTQNYAPVFPLHSYERAQSLPQAMPFLYVFCSNSTDERNVNTIGRLQNNIRPPARDLSTTAVLNTRELLQNPHNSVPHLRQRKLLANANPRASIERNVGP